MENNKAVGLARPLAVQMAAVVLMMIPLMDMVAAQRTGSYLFDVVSWVLVFGAGVSFLVRHKSSWILGMVMCAGFLLYNLYDIVVIGTSGMDPMVTTFRFMDCLLVVFIVCTVSYFFRYPYLDRRQRWFAPTSTRYAVEMPVVVNGSIHAKSLDLSYTGVRIALKDANKAFKPQQSISVQLSEVNDILCQGRIIMVSDSDVRVHFEDTSSQENELIRQWLLSQNLQKI